MNKPVPAEDDSRLPLAATIALGGLALFGAITLAGWLLSAVLGLVKTVIAVVIIIAVVGWITGRRWGD